MTALRNLRLKKLKAAKFESFFSKLILILAFIYICISLICIVFNLSLMIPLISMSILIIFCFLLSCVRKRLCKLDSEIICNIELELKKTLDKAHSDGALKEISTVTFTHLKCYSNSYTFLVEVFNSSLLYEEFLEIFEPQLKHLSYILKTPVKLFYSPSQEY